MYCTWTAGNRGACSFIVVWSRVGTVLGRATVANLRVFEFVWPVSGGIPPHGYYGDPRSYGPHRAVDISNWGGDQIRELHASEYGTATRHGSHEASSGYYIKVDHGAINLRRTGFDAKGMPIYVNRTVATVYMHMLNAGRVAHNTVVDRGADIGDGDSEGHVTGPHCHFELHCGTSKINPDTTKTVGSTMTQDAPIGTPAWP
jgi:murein DD-endopeptidase MepM/ murein hydrolase activator NlpD